MTGITAAARDAQPAVQRRALALTIGVALLIAGHNALWLAHDRFPSGYEAAEHILFARKIAADLNQALVAADPLPLALGRWLLDHRRIWTRATAIHLAVAPLFLVIGAGEADPLPWVIALQGAATLLVLAISCHLLARRIVPPWPAAWATIAMLCAPGIWGSARSFGVDLPHAAAVALLACWLVCGKPWNSAGSAATIGFFAGLCCLIKAQFVLWAPWLLLGASLARGATQQVRWVTFIAAAMAGSAFFWLGDLTEIIRTFAWHASALDNPSNEMPERWSVAALAYYPAGLLCWLGPGWWPLLALGLPQSLVLLWRREPLAWLATCWLLGAYACHVLIAVKFVRYMLPALPALMLLALCGLRTQPRRLQWLLLLPCISGAMIQLVGSWSALPVAHELRPLIGADEELVHPPIPSNWRAEVATLANLFAGFDPPRLVGIEGPAAWTGDDYSRF
jgi:hypothetical protein